MQLERRSRPRYGIALTSLVDVVFILLFFFMLAARAQPPAALELRLGQQPTAVASAVPVIDVLGGGRLRIAERDVALDALAAQVGGSSVVRLRAVAGSQLQDLVDALDAARSAGLSADWIR